MLEYHHPQHIKHFNSLVHNLFPQVSTGLIQQGVGCALRPWQSPSQVRQIGTKWPGKHEKVMHLVLLGAVEDVRKAAASILGGQLLRNDLGELFHLDEVRRTWWGVRREDGRM